MDFKKTYTVHYNGESFIGTFREVNRWMVERQYDLTKDGLNRKFGNIKEDA